MTCIYVFSIGEILLLTCIYYAGTPHSDSACYSCLSSSSHTSTSSSGCASTYVSFTHIKKTDLIDPRGQPKSMRASPTASWPFPPSPPPPEPHPSRRRTLQRFPPGGHGRPPPSSPLHLPLSPPTPCPASPPAPGQVQEAGGWRRGQSRRPAAGGRATPLSMAVCVVNSTH